MRTTHIDVYSRIASQHIMNHDDLANRSASERASERTNKRKEFCRNNKKRNIITHWRKISSNFLWRKFLALNVFWYAFDLIEQHLFLFCESLSIEIGIWCCYDAAMFIFMSTIATPSKSTCTQLNMFGFACCCRLFGMDRKRSGSQLISYLGYA